VSDVQRAADWYARALDGAIVSAAPDHAELRLGSERLPLLLERSAPPSPSNTPVLELGVERLAAWVDAAIDAGGRARHPALARRLRAGARSVRLSVGFPPALRSARQDRLAPHAPARAAHIWGRSQTTQSRFFFRRPLLTATDIATSIFFILVVCPD
jgi:hypothetical protein